MPEQTTSNLEDVASVSAKDVVNDKELRSLRPGSDEYKAAVAKKASEKSTPKTEAAPVADDTDEAPIDGKSKDKQDDKDKGKKPSKGIEKRFSELTNAEKAATEKATKAEQTNAELRAEIERLKNGGKEPVKPDTNPTTTFTDKEPVEDDYDTPKDYYRALASWESKKAVHDLKVEQAQQAANATQQTQLESFFSKGAEIEKDHGLDEGEFKILTTSPEVGKMIGFDQARHVFLTDPNGHKMLFDIISDEAEMAKVTAMEGADKLVYLGKLSAKYELKTKDAGTKKVSKAKAPPADLSGGAGVKVGTGMPDPKVDRKAWEKWRNEQRVAEGRRP